MMSVNSKIYCTDKKYIRPNTVVTNFYRQRLSINTFIKVDGMVQIIKNDDKFIFSLYGNISNFIMCGLVQTNVYKSNSFRKSGTYVFKIRRKLYSI